MSRCLMVHKSVWPSLLSNAWHCAKIFAISNTEVSQPKQVSCKPELSNAFCKPLAVRGQHAWPSRCLWSFETHLYKTTKHKSGSVNKAVWGTLQSQGMQNNCMQWFNLLLGRQLLAVGQSVLIIYDASAKGTVNKFLLNSLSHIYCNI